ncbi:MAG: DNA polymerase III subunit gamma/tau, partial [Calditrichia bacterium]
CNECASCREITAGKSMDVVEIDGASNRGIDEIRNLRENIRFAPAASRYKIYIIDEVHMLTKEAFNALLKTLEEPPSHAIFIFATTEIHRVPLTILSRCQRFDFKRIPTVQIHEHLQRIAKAEKIKVEGEALLLISRKADGSMRDAESILDQMISFSEGELTVEQVRRSLGVIAQDVYFDFTDMLEEKDNALILRYADKIISSGHELMDFAEGLQEHFRNFLLVKTLGHSRQLEVADHFARMYQEKAAAFQEQDLIHYIQIIADAERGLRYSTFPQLSLEMLLLKIAAKPASAAMEEILAFIRQFKDNPVLQVSGSSPQNSSATPAAKESNPPDYGASKVKEASGRQAKAGDDAKSKDEKTAAAENTARPGVSGKSGEFNFKSLKESAARLKDIKQTTPSETKDSLFDDKTDLSLEKIKEIWPEFIRMVVNDKRTLGTCLQEAVLHRFNSPDELVLAFDKKSEFHSEQVKHNLKYLQETLRDQFQLPVRLRIALIDFNNEGIEKEPVTPEELLQDLKKKEPIVGKIIDLFDLDEHPQNTDD